MSLTGGLPITVFFNGSWSAEICTLTLHDALPIWETLSGGTGNDTYIYAQGDGSDTIIETGGTNMLKPVARLTPFNITFKKIRYDLLIADGTAGRPNEYRQPQLRSSYHSQNPRFCH